MIKTVGVYCASSTQINKQYFTAAEELGQILAENHIACCNGGGGIGLMSAISDSIMKHGGIAIGVIPRFMVDMKWHHTALSTLHIVENMHERKAKMAELSDAIVALPGGIGTLEELLEILTWKQLGLFNKPIIILNIGGFFDQLLELLDKAIAEKFMRMEHKNMWQVIRTPQEFMSAINEQPYWDNSFRKIAAI